MEGARRIDEWSRIERKIPHLGVVPALAASEIGAEGQLDLLPPEWEVLAVIDGARDVRQLASLLGRSDFDVAKTLFGLESAGILALGDGPPARRGDGDDLTPLLESAERALDAGDLEGARGTVREAPLPVPSGWQVPWAGAVARYCDELIPILDLGAVAERLAETEGGRS